MPMNTGEIHNSNLKQPKQSLRHHHKSTAWERHKTDMQSNGTEQECQRLTHMSTANKFLTSEM